MNHIQTKRMIDLYNLMINFPEEIHFAMGKWVQNLGPRRKITCNTAACAGGAGVLFLLSWKKAGIILNDNALLDDNSPKYMSYFGTVALEKLLGLVGKESSYIFVNGSYFRNPKSIKQKHVAEHIAEVLQNHGVELEWDYDA